MTTALDDDPGRILDLMRDIRERLDRIVLITPISALVPTPPIACS